MASTPARGRSFGLGRGLDALIPSATEERGVLALDVDRIERNPDQPRTSFDETTLGELAASIAVHGVLQPVIVRQLADGGYQLVAGERRLRAARLAGLQTIPAIIREAGDEASPLELALIENLQRADLNAIEAALAYRELIDRFGLTHEAVARQVGKSRVAISNSLRLLDLAPDTRQAIVEGRITEGHGRALAAITIAELQRPCLRSSSSASSPSARRRSSFVASATSVRHASAGPSAPTWPTSRHSCAACLRPRSASCAPDAAAAS